MTDQLTERERWLISRVWLAAQRDAAAPFVEGWLNDSDYIDGTNNEYVLARDAPPADTQPLVWQSEPARTWIDACVLVKRALPNGGYMEPYIIDGSWVNPEDQYVRFDAVLAMLDGPEPAEQEGE